MSETIKSLGLLPHYDLFINGEFVPSTNPESKCTSKSPVDGSTLSTFANATKEDVDKAVDAAWEAFKTWKKIHSSSFTIFPRRKSCSFSKIRFGIVTVRPA